MVATAESAAGRLQRAFGTAKTRCSESLRGDDLVRADTDPGIFVTMFVGHIS